jgi:hypothetical protein
MTRTRIYGTDNRVQAEVVCVESDATALNPGLELFVTLQLRLPLFSFSVLVLIAPVVMQPIAHLGAIRCKVRIESVSPFVPF